MKRHLFSIVLCLLVVESCKKEIPEPIIESCDPLWNGGVTYEGILGFAGTWRWDLTRMTSEQVLSDSVVSYVSTYFYADSSNIDAEFTINKDGSFTYRIDNLVDSGCIELSSYHPCDFQLPYPNHILRANFIGELSVVKMDLTRSCHSSAYVWAKGFPYSVENDLLPHPEPPAGYEVTQYFSRLIRL